MITSIGPCCANHSPSRNIMRAPRIATGSTATPDAAAAMKEGRSDAASHLSAAKHLANQAALANCDSSIQLHGGIGVTDEHDCHLLLKHAMVLSRLFGGKRSVLSDLLHAGLED